MYKAYGSYIKVSYIWKVIMGFSLLWAYLYLKIEPLMRKSYGLRKHIKHFHVSITIHLLYHCPELKDTLATFIMHITVLVLYVRDYLPFHWKITRNQPHNTFIPWPTIEIGCLGHFTSVIISKLSETCHLPKELCVQCLNKLLK